MRRGQLGMRSEGRRGNYSFQRPQILMRLKMLTRDKMSLLRAASLRTAWETACGLNDRKKRGWVEAGILPTELLPLNWHLKYSKINRLRAGPKSPSLRIPDSTVSRTWHSIKNDLRHADELAENENGQYATSPAAHLKLLWVLSIGSLRLCRGLVIQELRNGFRILEHC